MVKIISLSALTRELLLSSQLSRTQWDRRSTQSMLVHQEQLTALHYAWNIRSLRLLRMALLSFTQRQTGLSRLANALRLLRMLERSPNLVSQKMGPSFLPQQQTVTSLDS